MPINPYTPGAAKRPSTLVGRSRQLALIDALIDQLNADRPAEDYIFTGLRGMGKTVFLKEAQDRFTARGWLCGYVEVRRGVEAGVAIAQIIADTYEATASKSWFKKVLEKSPVRLGSVTLSAPGGLASVTIEPAQRAAADAYRDLYTLLTALGRAAQKNGAGVALLIDELQQFKKRDLEVVLQVSRRLEGLPVTLIGAGLPTLPEVTSAAGTYSERFSFESIDQLSRPDARLAVTEPADEFSVTYEPHALDELVKLADGFPYFLQLYASETWIAAGFPSEQPGFKITIGHVNQAIPAVHRKVDAGLYRARYERASPAEKEYLAAMAALGSSSVSSGEVARQLDKTQAQLSTVRDRLIKKGIIHSPSQGRVEFSAPGFGDYVRRRSALDVQ
ncbi:MAG: ATP-binding protein [Acidimicrobiales bacterium]